MAIKIIKEPTSLFTMECEKCECVFTYNIDDITKHISFEYIQCPCCKEEIPHYKRNRDEE